MAKEKFIELDFDTWEEKYKPVTNERGEIRQYETYGDDLDIVTNTDYHYVWTWADGGDYSVIYSGTGFVNRLVYYITEVPWKEGEFIEIDMYEPDECETTGVHEYETVTRYDGNTYECCKHCGEDKEYLESIDD